MFLDGRDAPWVRVAELGAYADLMKTIAFRVMLIDGTSDWKLIMEQTPKLPLAHTSLPEFVLTAQGLK